MRKRTSSTDSNGVPLRSTNAMSAKATSWYATTVRRYEANTRLEGDAASEPHPW